MRMRITLAAILGLVGVAVWNGCLQTDGLLMGTGGSGGGGGSSSSSTTTTTGPFTTSSSTGGPSSSSTGSSSSSGCTTASVPCYTGMPSTTQNHMPCKAGTATCPWDGNANTCMNEIVPEPENCASGVDQNCDGAMTACTGTTAMGGKAWGEGADKGLAVAVGPAGNVIVGGYFNGMLNFGSGNVAAVGGQDAFVAKYDTTAKLVWVQHFGVTGSGQTGPQQVSAVAVDGKGDVYVAGNFTKGIPFPAANPVMGGPGIFVAKLDGNNGTPTWGTVFTAGDSNNLPVASGIAVSSDGMQIAVVGQVSGTTNLGTPAITTSGTGDYDGVVFTLDATGKTVGWVKQITDNNQQFQALNAVAMDAMGNVAVTGTAAGNVDFGDMMPVTAPSTGNGDQAAAAALYKSDGSIVWKQLYGGSFFTSGNGVSFGGGGDVLVTGAFAGTIGLSSLKTCTTASDCTVPKGQAAEVCSMATSTCTTVLTAQGTNDVFVTRLTGAMGGASWAKSFGATNQDDQGLGIAADTYGLVVSGYFQGALTADSTPTLTAVGGRDALAMKLDVTGNVLWAKKLGDMGDDKATGVALDPSPSPTPGSSVVTGYFKTKIDVGTGSPVPGTGNTNIFFVRLNP